MNKQTIILAILLVSFAVLSRFLPHPVNFAPLGALGLYAGTFFVDKRYWLLPVVALLLSDALLGFYHWISMLFVYAGFVFAVIIGRIGPGKKLSAFRFGMAVFLGANIFFILSNFGTWLSGTLYPLTLGGWSVVILLQFHSMEIHCLVIWFMQDYYLVYIYQLSTLLQINRHFIIHYKIHE